MKYILSVLTCLSLLTAHSQIDESNLMKGTWKFCIVDTMVSPFTCDGTYSVYKFSGSGRYVQTGVSKIYHGKEIKEIKGVWRLDGTTLIIDPDDFENLIFYPRKIPLQFLSQDVLFSSQEDYKTVYWIFSR